MQAVILAGGAGKRMGELARDVPKPMVPIAGRPILEHLIAWARREGVERVLLLIGHKGDVIRQHFGDGSAYGLAIDYHQETEPLGTAGAVREVADRLDESFLVLYGDTVLDLDLAHLTDAHASSGALATLVVHPNDHPHDSDLLEAEDSGLVTAFHRKPREMKDGLYLPNLVSAAMYVMSRDLLQHVEPGAFADFGRDVFPKLVEGGKRLHAYNTPQYIKDVGTPQRLAEVAKDIETGRVERFNRRHRRPAVFFDRDGVLNKDAEGMVCRPDQFELLSGAAESIRRVNRSDYLAVVVTNQPIIAKGFASFDDLAAIHARMETLLGEQGAYVDRIYFCPHHPERGFEGERSEYKIDCACRKPGTGMIDRGVAELGVDPAGSFIIGDRTTDIECGRRADLRTILVRTGAAGADGKVDVTPDHVADDVSAAVDWVLNDA